MAELWAQIGNARTDELGIHVLKVNRPVLAEVTDFREGLPFLPGSVLFNTPFGMKEITLECYVRYKDSGLTEVQQEREIAKLYSGEEVRIVLSDEEDVYYIGKISEGIMLERHTNVAKFTLTLLCQPFATEHTSARIEKKGQTSGADHAFQFVNTGTAYSECTVRITPGTDLNELALKVNESELHLKTVIPAGSEVIFNTESFSVQVNDKEHALDLYGEFPLVEPGENQVIISGNTQFNYDIKIEYSRRYL